MKVEVQIDPALDEPVIVLRAPGPGGEVEALAEKLRALALPKPFTVYQEREPVRVNRAAARRPARVVGKATGRPDRFAA